LGIIFKLNRGTTSNNDPPQKNKSIRNLSKLPLTKPQEKVLGRGLKFIPTPSKVDKDLLKEAVARFGRQVRIAHFFAENTSYARKKFKNPSNWSPPFTPEDIEQRLDTLTEAIEFIQLNPAETNLSKPEKIGLKELRRNSQIIIKPADKGSATVIMDTVNYIFEAERQLSNPLHYKLLDSPVYPRTAQEITKILETLVALKYLDKDQFAYLAPPEVPKPRRFYLLPKIHKKEDTWTIPGKMPPGRPIISDCGSESYRVSEYIDHFLLPVSTSHPAYLKDTPHFLDTIGQLRIPNNSLLITIDVDGLYTNINNSDGLQAVSDSLDLLWDPERPTKHILELLRLSLENNDFIFNSKWYLQTFGVAMGKKFAPAYANIFMARWEAGALAKCPLQPLVYKRFLDDIFIVWTHGHAEFETFFQILQNHHESINLKYEINQDSVNFLDTTVFKGPRFQTEGILDTRVFFKETDSLQLLDKRSYHPKHTFSGIIKSQILRYKRICNNKQDIERACNKLFRALKSRGYTQRFLRKIKNDTLYPQDQPLGQSVKCTKPRCKICAHVTPSSVVSPAGPHNLPDIQLATTQDCTNSNGIYYIHCSDCKVGYVGETGNSFKIRITQHLSDIRTGKDTRVAQHFRPHTTTCNLDSFKLTFLETIPLSGNTFVQKGTRIERERYWIQRLQTSDQIYGLNSITRPLDSPILPFVVRYSGPAGELAKMTRETFMALKGIYPKALIQKLVIAYSRNPNLKDRIVRSQFGPTPEETLMEVEREASNQETLNILAQMADAARDSSPLGSPFNSSDTPSMTSPEQNSLPTPPYSSLISQLSALKL